jgi:deazaflavin-dependent oxidoreductase (nitroreductase family)
LAGILGADAKGSAMAADAVRRRWLWFIKHSLNRVTVPAARAGWFGPLALIRHVGRKSGRTYETPLLLARVTDGFVAELTYGENVDWYRNVVHAGRCTIVADGIEHEVDQIRKYPYRDGWQAFGWPAAPLLKALNRREFRLLRVAESPRSR